MLGQLTDEELSAAEQDIANQKREREHAKWDAELIGRYFRIIRTPTSSWWRKPQRFVGDDYVTLEESLSVSGDRYVYADVVYLHIQKRDNRQLTCAGFEVSNANRKEPYLKIQPVFYSLSDFRNYLNSWSPHTGPTKHFDEVTKEEYEDALNKAVKAFTKV